MRSLFQYVHQQASLTASTSWIYLILLNPAANVTLFKTEVLIVQTLYHDIVVIENGGRGISEYEKILTPQSDSQVLSDI